MRAGDGSKQVVSRVNIGDPVAQGFVYGIFECSASGCDCDHLGPQQLHASHIQCLPLGVYLAHVYDAIEAEQRCRCRRCYAVLTSTGFCDDALLAHAFG